MIFIQLFVCLWNVVFSFSWCYVLLHFLFVFYLLFEVILWGYLWFWLLCSLVDQYLVSWFPCVKVSFTSFFVGSLWLIFKSGYLSLLFLVLSLSYYLLVCSLCVFIHFLLLSHLCLSTFTCMIDLSSHSVEVILSLDRFVSHFLFYFGKGHSLSLVLLLTSTHLIMPLAVCPICYLLLLSQSPLVHCCVIPHSCVTP